MKVAFTALTLCLCPALAHAGNFNFASLAPGTATPLSLTVDGLTATFASTADPGAFEVGSDHRLRPTADGVQIAVSFDASILSIQFDATGMSHDFFARSGGPSGTIVGGPSGLPGAFGFSGGFDWITWVADNSFRLQSFDSPIPQSSPGTGTPEPASWILLGLGLPLVIMRTAWLRRRSRRSGR